ncbi:hypothetical protein P3X46_014531 [Hevea brasiliensis]|uniref:C2H2-type domain-containing protein n=1 Tax=Hevea brasiliensis TaxID=3981 RepID=A0ABQ9M7P7_HEVBR|nr:zinc finger protein ZAT5-like [Hevea brasiliensis]XP_058008054.1 zinc finger protein ZAT5-like [Hevea brasiliensis]KAJ9175482.1 hypothetical protein P3X46_014032 [Hevea brasiliensis]KAJ9176041.1 hypothetical protein P3X46_014531 [Hevea brasiliensis]
MEAQEEVTSNNIVKGKRTKRQRVQSPIPFANLTSNSLSGDGGGVDGDGDGDVCVNGKICANVSPTTSQEFQDSTQEEEDMANCLILLAQGHINNTFKDSSPKQDDNYAAGVYNPAVTAIAATTTNNKFNSRKFLETGSPGSGKVGYYVYECKTCNRAFPSFQALGGHRASHKKPKNDEKKQFAISSDEEDGHFRDVSSLSLQLSNNNNNRGMYSSSNQNKTKIHECSVCGAEFTSGQALGGHMRRHRTPIGANTRTTLSLAPMAKESEEPKKARNLLSLDLDLNLPAPENEILSFASKEQKQQQQQQQQQPEQQQKPSLVFSGPALVDCQY